MVRKCGFWWMAISSGLGIFVGLVVFFVFTFYYRNDYAGGFGLISGIFAAIALHLTLLNYDDHLVTWYSPNNLKSMAAFAAVVSIISFGITLFFFIFAYTHNIPMMPVSGSYYVSGVWSGLTCKWALIVTFLSFRYARILQYTIPFLVVQEQE